MYKIGQKIVYPMHGAGVIQEIEERVILGEKKEYYILNVPCNDMKIMIPVGRCSEIGVRPIITKKKVDEILSILVEATVDVPTNWNHRYRENVEKMKTGDVGLVAQVVRNLIRLDRSKPLSTGEKKMLSNAKHILISELTLASGKTIEQIEAIIEEKV